MALVQPGTLAGGTGGAAGQGGSGNAAPVQTHLEYVTNSNNAANWWNRTGQPTAAAPFTLAGQLTT